MSEVVVNPYMIIVPVSEDCQSEGTEGAYMQEPPSGGGSGSKQRIGCKLESGSVFVGETYSSAKVFLKKETGSPNLNLNVSIYRDGTALPVHTFQTISTSTITDEYAEYTLSGGGDYTIVANDIIAINWESEDYKLYTYVYGSAVSNLPQMRYNQWDDPNRTTWTAFTSSSFRFCLGA